MPLQCQSKSDIVACRVMLPPKADIGTRSRHVRYVPIRDIARPHSIILSASTKSDQFKSHRWLNRQIARLLSPQDFDNKLADVDGSRPCDLAAAISCFSL